MYYVIKRQLNYPFEKDLEEIMTDAEYLLYALTGDRHRSRQIPDHLTSQTPLEQMDWARQEGLKETKEMIDLIRRRIK